MRQVIVLSLVAVFVTASCAADPGAPPASEGRRPAVSDPLTAPATGAGSDAPTPIPTLVTEPPHAVSMAWELVGRSTDGRDLSLRYIAGDGDCVHLAGAVVTSTTAQVEVAVYGEQDPSKDACGSGLFVRTGSVRLADALEDRPLRHAPVDDDWAAGLEP